MQFGVQLFGILKDRREGTLDALRDLRKLGFRRIEPCVSIGGVIPNLEHVIWPAEWLEAHIGEIQEIGLEIPSAHVFASDISLCTDALIRLSQRCGIRQFVVKSPEKLSPESLQEASLRYMRAADALASIGAELLIHNEWADIAAHFEGKTAYEHLLGLCLGKVGAQVDIGWVQYGGEDPLALLRRNASLVRSMHYKDFRREGDQLVQTTVGNGIVDNAACFQFARAAGTPQLIDQDEFIADIGAELTQCVGILSSLVQYREGSVSYLNTLNVDTGEVKVLWRFEGVIEAPNWVQNEEKLVYNADGRLYTLDIESKDISCVDTGLCDCCNNDHVLSPDGKAIAVSHMPEGQGLNSTVYIVPLNGGAPRKVTQNVPSFLHGWSPDGKELAYCAFRPQDWRADADVYSISVEGGEERRLTQGGFNDGPEYAPDGQSIWFNSTRTGLMQVWRMNRDGTGAMRPEQPERNNWFPHVSPDGRRVVFLSYGKNHLEPHEHLPNMQVELWLMNADGTGAHRILSFFGGQGSINVNSWSSDGKRLAFVSYETH